MDESSSALSSIWNKGTSEEFEWWSEEGLMEATHPKWWVNTAERILLKRGIYPERRKLNSKKDKFVSSLERKNISSCSKVYQTLTVQQEERQIVGYWRHEHKAANFCEKRQIKKLTLQASFSESWIRIVERAHLKKNMLLLCSNLRSTVRSSWMKKWGSHSCCSSLIKCFPRISVHWDTWCQASSVSLLLLKKLNTSPLIFSQSWNIKWANCCFCFRASAVDCFTQPRVSSTNDWDCKRTCWRSETKDNYFGSHLLRYNMYLSKWNDSKRFTGSPLDSTLRGRFE